MSNRLTDKHAANSKVAQIALAVAGVGGVYFGTCLVLSAGIRYMEAKIFRDMTAGIPDSQRFVVPKC